MTAGKLINTTDPKANYFINNTTEPIKEWGELTKEPKVIDQSLVDYSLTDNKDPIYKTSGDILDSMRDKFDTSLVSQQPGSFYDESRMTEEQGTGLSDESEEQEENLDQIGINTARASEVFEEVVLDVNKIKLLSTKITNSELLKVSNVLTASEIINLSTKETVGWFENSAESAKEGFLAVQALIASFVAMKTAFNRNKSDSPRQHGGMINEPIFGIGESGTTYSFGEAGPEMVTPMFGGKPKGGGIGPVNINVNIEKVSDDVDLEKLKPVIERALQEVHARRGII